MNNVLRTLIAFSTLGVSAVCAASLEPVRVTVPFAFTAGKVNLPAGEYIVSEQSSNFVLIRGEHGAAFIMEHASASDVASTSGVTFLRTTDGYCLQDVHTAGKPSALLTVAPVSRR